MPLIEWWKVVVLQRYGQFTGRAGRAEYWWYVLANVIIYLVLGVLSRASVVFVVLYFAVWLALLLPSLAVAVRRLHDTNKTGAWLFLVLIPFVGGIILIVFLATAGDRGVNRYGPPPPPMAFATA